MEVQKKEETKSERKNVMQPAACSFPLHAAPHSHGHLDSLRARVEQAMGAFFMASWEKFRESGRTRCGQERRKAPV
jgi:hypothetical protein